MAFCKECGGQLTEGSRFCTTCGAQTPSAAEPVMNQEPPRAEPQPTYQPPTYTQPSYAVEPQEPVKQNVSKSRQSAYRQQAYGGYDQPSPPQAVLQSPVMSTGQFLGTLLLMMIPIAGFILTIVWACGGTDNHNRRNLARAYLILIAIGLVLGILLAVLFSALAFTLVDELDKGWNWEFSQDFGDSFSGLDDFSGEFGHDFDFQSIRAGGGMFALV